MDRRFLLRPVTWLLVVIVFLQIVLVVLHLRSRSAPGVSSRLPAKTESEAIADAVLKLELASAQPEVRRVVGQLHEALAKQEEPVSFGVLIEDVRVESASGIGEIVISARLRNGAPLPLEGFLSRLQLRDAAGALLYQASGELSEASGESWLPGSSGRVRFLVDNPPLEFSQVRLVLDRLDFASGGY